MAKDLSVSNLKGRAALGAEKPMEGSALRTLYDLLYVNRGKAVHLSDIKAALGAADPTLLPSMRQNLRLFYGLDIRPFQHGQYRYVGQKRSRAAWLLAGEHVGRGYIDYVVKR